MSPSRLPAQAWTLSEAGGQDRADRAWWGETDRGEPRFLIKEALGGEMRREAPSGLHLFLPSLR